MKKVILGFFLLLLGLVAVLVFNTLTFESKQMEVASLDSSSLPSIDKEVIQHLSTAVTYPTVSHEGGANFDTAAFLGLHHYIDSTFEQVATQLKKETVKEFSLLYTWEGTNPDKKPIILLGHMDVVPAEGKTLESWTEAPFKGTIKDGYIWGRGTLDDKISVFGILEAVEQLIKDGFRPEQTIYLAFGHDEEIGGTGAEAIAALLESRGIKAAYAMDEGGLVSSGIVPGIQNKQVALIGTAEKGYLSVHLQVNLDGGHSSMPAKETAIGLLSNAVVKLHESPIPAKLSDPVLDFASYVGPEMPFVEKMVFANLWLFERVLINIYEKSPSGNATVHTTQVPTIFNSGVKDNLIPTEANLTMNFRLLPGDSKEEVLEHIKSVINDERIKVSVVNNVGEATSPSKSSSDSFKSIQKTITEVYPNTMVSPYLTIAGTDAKHYEHVAEDIYRFLPTVFDSNDLRRLHGIDERIKTEDYIRAVQFYYQLIRNSQGKSEQKAEIAAE
ncbi:M20 family peptidase [Limibacter armeniacum]|uniref:M20 family peptidase n=1 Tax=Limibacter armeniacum TaxID=466084 RepID=UPI002FE6780B